MVFLKSIEAKGFKSFADKTTIEFNDGVTAVVGPNGSGKSNIIDAVRFVLGETSAKQFRGSKMEDVIFNGTTERSKQNSAVVQLNLDNKDRVLDFDYDNVTIRRELFRSGESNYYINKERAKLKDVTELFMDSGLGKHAYNIISQGEVDHVLNQKPETRREIIEEVAGVMKYKTRKKEAERKLDDTLLNLSRIHDITSELESRVKKLEKESAIATEYLALLNEMKQSDIEVTVFDIKELSSKLHQLKETYSNDERTIEDARNHVNLLDVAINNLRDKREVLTEKERSIHDAFVKASREKEQTIGKIELFKERKTSRTDQHDSLTEEKSNKLKEQQSLEHDLEALRTSFNETKDEQSNVKAEIDTINASLQSLVDGNDVDIDALKEQYYAVMVEKTSLDNQLKDYEKQEAIDSSKREELDRRMNELKESLDTLNEKNKSLTDTLSTLESSLKDKREAYKETKSKRDHEESHIQSLTEQFDTANRYISQLTSKRDMYESMMSNYDGYYRGVKSVLKRKDKLTGVLGAVMELIEIDSAYMTALDAALGSQTQSVVTKTEQDAKRAIHYLKDKNLGYATFLPLDTIQRRSLSQEVVFKLESTSVEHHILKDLVDTKYDALIGHLFSTTIIVENYDDGARLSRELNFKARIVTQDGEIFNPGGAVSGGSRQNNNSALKLRKEKDALDDKIKAYTLEVDRLTKELSKEKDSLKELDTLLNTLETEGIQLKESYDEQSQLLEQTNQDIKLTNERIALLKETFDSTTETMEASTLIKAIEEKTKTLDSLQKDIQLLTKAQGDTEAAEKEYESKKQTLLTKQAELESTLRYKRSQVTDYEERLLKVKREIVDIDSRIEMLTSDYESIDIEALETLSLELDEQLDVLQDSSSQLKKEIHEVSEETKHDVNLRQSHLDTIEKLSESLRKTHGKKERVESMLSVKIDYLSETYEMTFERAEKEYTDLTDIDMKRERIQLNKKSIDELGNVNLNAIDEFEVVNERYTFLKHEEDDLLQARETLLDVIKEMDYEVSERFKETYHNVNEHFKKVFKTMFGGGEAELRLTEPGDYLNAGLLIYAQPPGKKLTSMSLLSGGERALTAISLLFSILEVRSSPFIILDEVEAALDEANVLRFSNYLRHLTRYSQCIVITHRKKTMEQSDRLFGVTMQEKGVSELISVDLKTYEEREVEGEY